VDHLEPRNLLSTTVAGVAHAPDLSPAFIVRVAAAHARKPARPPATVVAASGSADPSYFLALGLPDGVRNWVGKNPQKHIQDTFGDKVTVIRPLHISLVRDINDIANLKTFDNEVAGVVKEFETGHGGINQAFEFKPTTGKVAPQNNHRFYVYNLSASGASSDDFKTLSHSLAALAPGSAPESAANAHMSVFYNWSADTTKVAKELNKCCQEHLHAFHANDVMLVESLGKHEYKVVKSWG